MAFHVSTGPERPKSSTPLTAAVVGDPGHQLRMREVLRSAAHFPDALVRSSATFRSGSSAAPSGSSSLRARARAGTCGRHAAHPSARHRRRAAAGRRRRCRCGRASSLRSRRARQSFSCSRRSPARPYMICSCEGGRPPPAASNRRQAFASVAVAGSEQRVERERRVADPAKAVVPVPLAADLFRQRGRRRRHDPAGRA